jgi:hypothetical protein
MSERTRLPAFASRFFFASEPFQVLDVVLRLFPTMAIITVEPIRTPLLIFQHFFVFAPIFARTGLQFFEKRSFEILPVVRVDASISVVVDLGERTELAFEVEKEKVLGDREEMEGGDLEFVVGMGQGAVLCVFALARLDKVLAVLPLVVVDVVDLLYEVLGVFTVGVCTCAFLWAEDLTIEHVVERTPSLGRKVREIAALDVVGFAKSAGSGFEIGEIQVQEYRIVSVHL